MGMQQLAPSAPDTDNLPEFYVTDVATEIAGGNVRIICGVRRCGQVRWLYSAVMPAELLLAGSKQCREAAIEALSFLQMRDCGAHH